MIKRSADAGDNLDELLGNPIGDQAAAAVESVKNNSDAATASMKASFSSRSKGWKRRLRGEQNRDLRALQNSTQWPQGLLSDKGYAGPLAAMFDAKMMFTNFIDEGDKLDKLSKKSDECL
ncbi:MAG: hypothetical protein ACLSE8_00100 [Parasutterella sp.]